MKVIRALRKAIISILLTQEEMKAFMLALLIVRLENEVPSSHGCEPERNSPGSPKDGEIGDSFTSGGGRSPRSSSIVH